MTDLRQASYLEVKDPISTSAPPRANGEKVIATRDFYASGMALARRHSMVYSSEDKALFGILGEPLARRNSMGYSSEDKVLFGILGEPIPKMVLSGLSRLN